MTELAAVGVSKSFPGGHRALSNVNLTVASRDTLALVGASGSGKSTLLRLFNRMVEPEGGRVLVGGREVTTLGAADLRRRTGYVPQSGGLIPHWTVERNVELVPRLLEWDSERRRKRRERMLKLVGLPAERFGNRHPHELSGGERQRVAFARALAADPEVVLLDEPFSALDVLTRRELHAEFDGWRQELRQTILMVTHDLAEAAKLADRIAVLHEGELQQVGTIDELRRSPATSYVEALLTGFGEAIG